LESPLVSEVVAKPTPLQREAAGLDACVHCGFCLSACPTYLALEDENDSPRGRLVLMRALLDGELALSDSDAGEHLDRCLGCRGCETACPSGVPYGKLLEAARATMAEARALPVAARAVLFVFARHGLLRASLTLARVFRATGIPRLLGRLKSPIWFPFAMLASTARQTANGAPHAAHGEHTVEPTRGSVAVLTGCVMEGLFAPVNRATERVLDEQGYRLTPAPRQQCCGALHAHAGDRSKAQALARANIAAFEACGADYIAVNAAGCGAAMKDYGHLLADDAEWAARAASVAARVRDVSELLADAGPRTVVTPPRRITYDAPCHLQHAQRVIAPPLAVLRAMEGPTLVPLAGSDQCCGSAGIFNLVQPGVADAVLRPKLAAIAATHADIVATGNPGCLMQIGGGLLRNGSATRARHPVELLANAYADADAAGPR
jgi:glycolate oxidase iron-sulfur subunit